MSATAQICEFPGAAAARKRLAVAAPVREDLEADLSRLTRSATELFYMVAVLGRTVDGIEQMADAERDRADEAEQLLAESRGASIRAIAARNEIASRLAEVSLEVEGLRAQLAEARDETERERLAHAEGLRLLRDAVKRRQSEIEAARLQCEKMEAELLKARDQVERSKGLALAVGEACAVYAESRAEGFVIAQDIRAALARFVAEGRL
jgi:chromosome segregation ATPase